MTARWPTDHRFEDGTRVIVFEVPTAVEPIRVRDRATLVRLPRA